MKWQEGIVTNVWTALYTDWAHILRIFHKHAPPGVEENAPDLL